MPKKALMDPETFAKRLKQRSQWWQSILDPISGAGARIPDPCGYHTATFQSVKRYTVPVNAQGIAGLRLTTPYLANGSTGTTRLNGQIQMTDAASSSANLNWGNGAGSPGASTGFAEAEATLCAGSSSLASVIRPVSGCVMATYTGTSLSDAGTLVSYTNPGGIEANTVSDSRLKQLFGTSLTPVKANRAAISRLLPIQRGAVISAAVPIHAADYRDFVSADLTGSLDRPPRELGVYLVGGTPSTGSLEYVVVVNYEFVPRFQTGGLIAAQPSPVDPLEEAFVLSNLNVEDATGTCSIKQFSAAPSASSVTQAVKREESGPMSTMTEAAGFLGSILEVGLPLLGALL